jgi:hypothetical protein
MAQGEHAKHQLLLKVIDLITQCSWVMFGSSGGLNSPRRLHDSVSSCTEMTQIGGELGDHGQYDDQVEVRQLIYEPNPKHKPIPTPGRHGSICPRNANGAALARTE